MPILLPCLGLGLVLTAVDGVPVGRRVDGEASRGPRGAPITIAVAIAVVAAIVVIGLGRRLADKVCPERV